MNYLLYVIIFCAKSTKNDTLGHYTSSCITLIFSFKLLSPNFLPLPDAGNHSSILFVFTNFFSFLIFYKQTPIQLRQMGGTKQGKQSLRLLFFGPEGQARTFIKGTHNWVWVEASHEGLECFATSHDKDFTCMALF